MTFHHHSVFWMAGTFQWPFTGYPVLCNLPWAFHDHSVSFLRFFVTIQCPLRHVTRQLSRQFRADRFILKLSIIVTVHQQYNNTMQTKQNRTFIQIEARFTRDYFFCGRILSRKCSKSSMFVGNVFNISLFLDVLLFLCARDIWNRVQTIF